MRYTSADDHGNSRWRFSHNSNAVFFLISSYSKLVEIIDVWSHRKIGMNSNGYFIASCSVLPTNSYLLLVQSFIITDIIVIMFFFRLHFFILFLYFDSMKQCCRVKKHMKKKKRINEAVRSESTCCFFGSIFCCFFYLPSANCTTLMMRSEHCTGCGLLIKWNQINMIASVCVFAIHEWMNRSIYWVN